MKAVAYQECLPISHGESLVDVDLPEPAPGPHDLLVEVRAVAVNPVDTKMRALHSLPRALEGARLGRERHGVRGGCGRHTFSARRSRLVRGIAPAPTQQQ